MAKNNRQSEIFQLQDCEVMQKTLHAVLIRYDYDEYWIPLSQIHGPIDIGDTEVNMTPWIAREKGLCY